MDWAQILVTILAIFLALFLLMSIILLVMLIRVTRQIRAVATSAERTARRIDGLVATFVKVASPLGLLRFVKQFIKRKKVRHE